MWMLCWTKFKVPITLIHQRFFCNNEKSLGKHLLSCGLSREDFDKIPPYYRIRMNSPAKFILLSDPKLAQTIAQKICNHLHSDTVLEFDAGFGFMSEIFIRNSRTCRLYEHSSTLRKLLQKKCEDYGENVPVLNESFHNILGMIYNDCKKSENDYNRMFENLPLSPWTESNWHFSMVIPVMSSKNLRTFITNYIEEDSFRQFGLPEIFLLVPDQIRQVLLYPRSESHGSRRRLSYLINIFCDIEVLLENLSRLSFLPWPPKMETGKQNQTDSMCLLRIVPKFDRFVPYEDPKFLTAVLVLLRSSLQKNLRIIPTLESYASECGFQFILEDDLTPYTEFYDIVPEKYFSLMTKLKEYPDFCSSFMKSAKLEEVSSS